MEGALLSGNGKGLRPHSIRRKYSPSVERKFPNKVKDSPECLEDQKEMQCSQTRKSSVENEGSFKGGEKRKVSVEHKTIRERVLFKDAQKETENRNLTETSTDMSKRKSSTVSAKSQSSTVQSLPWTPHKRLILSLNNFTSKSLPFYLQALSHHTERIQQVG